MTLATVLLWSCVRAIVITSVGLPLAILVSRTLCRTKMRPVMRRVLIVAALLPLFVPDLLIGFTYRLTSAKLIHSVIATEGLYALLLLFRVTALQVAVQLVLPGSAVALESLHTWKLAGRNTHRTAFKWARWTTWLRLQVFGPTRAPLAAWLAGALLCFQEFETAALLQIDRYPIAWTVWLFDAHAAGEPLTRSLMFTLPALCLQAMLLVPALILLASGPSLDSATFSPKFRGTTPENSSLVGRGLAWTVLATSLGVVFLWPMAANAREAIDGLQSLFAQSSVWDRFQQILLSLIEAAIAAVVALQVCIVVQNCRSRSLTLVVVIPGLVGSLGLSLTLLAVFQTFVFHRLYDTWLPMIAGHTLWLLPRAFLLVTLLNIVTGAASRHSVNLLSAAAHNTGIRSSLSLRWIMQQRRWIIVFAVLTHWCLWDVTIASSLRPIGFEPVVTRLYNEMHYGSTELLAALTLLTLGIPLLAFLMIGVAARYPGRRQST